VIERNTITHGPAATAGNEDGQAPVVHGLDVDFDDLASVRAAADRFRGLVGAVRTEIGKVIVGQQEVVDLTLMALLAGGHVLLEGVPGLGKTLLVRTLGDVLGLSFSRIQFTPDVMPADITGTSVVVEDGMSGHRSFRFSPGPLFHQIILADEINRATPKSQSALLEAMQERSVTVAGRTRELPRPFLVLATQNPIEQEGTYPLPEAQLDRFLLKVRVPLITRDEGNEIIDRTTTGRSHAPKRLLDDGAILAAQRLARRAVVAPEVEDYVIRLVLATHPGGPHSSRDLTRVIRVGASPRAAQAMITAAKVRAMLDGRYHAAIADVRALAAPALRHRLILSFEAQADGIDDDRAVAMLLEHVPVEASATSDTSRSGRASS